MPIFKYKNEEFFKKWSTEMAYLLGYIAADGALTIGKRNNHFLDVYSTVLINGSLFYNGNAWRLSYGINESKKLYQFMYPPNCQYFLKRKHEVFVKALAIMGR